MNDRVQCAECEAILDEFRSAAGIPTRAQMEAAREITLKAILATDDETLGELIEKHPYRLPPDGLAQAPRNVRPALQAVFRRLWRHRVVTGHWPLPFR